jgi:cytochrome c oxidase cbb3-type subunit 2
VNKVIVLALGVLCTVILSFIGLVWAPYWQLYDIQPKTITNDLGQNVTYPASYDELSTGAGRRVYIAYGCIYCHSQQVRPSPQYTDIERGWGQRRSVPRDYLLEHPPLMGTMRTGPDLANIGLRQPALNWHHLHLFDPQIVSPGSIMPAAPFWYDRTEIDPGEKGYLLPEAYYGKKTWIIPKKEASLLVEYLISREQAHRLEQVE